MEVKNLGINGLHLIGLDIVNDERGSFREAYQAEKLNALGVQPLNTVQANVSVSRYGVIRGIHAEPWNKYIHVAKGEVYAAIIDLRRSSNTFGAIETVELNEEKALYVPEGCGNSFAALSEEVIYTYLVTGTWTPDNPYPALAYDDPELGIPWPIPEAERIVSDKDRKNPTFKEAYSK